MITAQRIRKPDIEYVVIDLSEEGSFIGDQVEETRECSREDLFNFARKCSQLRPEIRFQNWNVGQYHVLFSRIPSIAWRNNTEFLRYGIETPQITELRLDLDLKNEEGEKDIAKNVRYGLWIKRKLQGMGLRPSLYYGGGMGMHIHALIRLPSLSFLSSYEESVNLEEYENEFRMNHEEKQMRETPNLDYIEKRNKERRQFKRAICDYLGITEFIDINLLSSQVMLTLEGTEKRNSKTNNKKIYIGEEEEERVLQEIKNNKKRQIINLDYFQQVGEVHSSIIPHLEEKAHTLQNRGGTEPKSEKIFSRNEPQDSPNTLRRHSLPDESVIMQHLITFGYLYKRKCLSSTNKFYQMVGVYCYSSTLDKDKAIYYFDKFLEVCPNNMRDISPEQKMEIIITRYQQGMTKIFTYPEYCTKEEFYRTYYELFPKQKPVSFRGQEGQGVEA